VFKFLGIFLGIKAADRNAPGIGSSQAFHDLHGGSFPCAIGAQQAKYFAFLNVETDASYGLNIAVAFY